MRVLLSILGFAAILVPGIAHGLWTERWHTSEEPIASAERLSQALLELKDWDAVDLPLNRRQIEKAEIAGFLARRYVNRATDITFSVFLACGKPGPISLHAPDICYPSSGFEMVTEIKRVSLEGLTASNKAEFAVAEFEKPNSEKQRMRIYWSWGANGQWQVPATPRLAFGNQPVLHKLYVIQPLLGKRQSDQETGIKFLQVLLPELERSLFTPR